MRSVFLLSLVLFSPPAFAGTAHRPYSVDKGCPDHLHMADSRQPAASGAQKLGDLPPANELLTVIHQEDGCQHPVIVRYGIGGNPAARGATPAR